MKKSIVMMAFAVLFQGSAMAASIIKTKNDRFAFKPDADQFIEVGDFVDVYRDGSYLGTAEVKKMRKGYAMGVLEDAQAKKGDQVVIANREVANTDEFSNEVVVNNLSQQDSNKKILITGSYLQDDREFDGGVQVESTGYNVAGSIEFSLTPVIVTSSTLGLKLIKGETVGDSDSTISDLGKGINAESTEIYFNQSLGYNMELSRNFILRPFIGVGLTIGAMDLTEEDTIAVGSLGDLKYKYQQSYSAVGYSAVAGLQTIIAKNFVPFVQYEYGKMSYSNSGGSLELEGPAVVVNAVEYEKTEIQDTTNQTISAGLSYRF